MGWALPRPLFLPEPPRRGTQESGGLWSEQQEGSGVGVLGWLLGSENDGDLTTMTITMIEDITWIYPTLSSVSCAIRASPHFTWTTLSQDTERLTNSPEFIHELGGQTRLEPSCVGF